MQLIICLNNILNHLCNQSIKLNLKYKFKSTFFNSTVYLFQDVRLKKLEMTLTVMRPHFPPKLLKIQLWDKTIKKTANLEEIFALIIQNDSINVCLLFS